MIVIDQLRISDDGSMLFLDAHVNTASHFDNIVIDKVVVQNQDQVSEMDPLTPGSSCIYSMEIEEDTKEIHLCLNAATDFEEVYSSLSGMLLFVYIVCRGVADPCTPCRLDELTTLAVTFDTNLLYQKIMQLTRELADTCNIPKGLIDLILLWNGFKAAVETEHYLTAIDFWKKMFNRQHGIASLNITKDCGCHG